MLWKSIIGCPSQSSASPAQALALVKSDGYKPWNKPPLLVTLKEYYYKMEKITLN